MTTKSDDAIALDIIANLQVQLDAIEALRDAPITAWNKRALSVAITELETAMLWLANARPD